MTESLGDSAPVPAIVDGRFLLSDNEKRAVFRRPDGVLQVSRDNGAGSTGLSEDEARSLDLPGTRLTWRFMGGRTRWRGALPPRVNSPGR